MAKVQNCPTNEDLIIWVGSIISAIPKPICLPAIDPANVKSSKIKVQVKINGNELRVEGKKKDDLQAVMKMIEEAKVGIPIQFINFRD